MVGLCWYLYHPLPKYYGHKSIKGLNRPVDIYTDTYGVPHIFAENEEDLFYAAGYYAARDRLFQMSIVNYSVRGELSYAFGDDFISSDIYLRTWRIHDTAKRLVGELDKETVGLIRAFCAGINYRIQEVYNDLPLEFKISGMKPLAWNPSIVTGYARMMAREMSQSWKPEIVFGAIEKFFGREKLAEIYPNYDSSHPTIAGKNSLLNGDYFTSILKEELKLQDILGYNSSFSGSNNWVVSGERTKTRKQSLGVKTQKGRAGKTSRNKSSKVSLDKKNKLKQLKKQIKLLEEQIDNEKLIRHLELQLENPPNTTKIQRANRTIEKDKQFLNYLRFKLKILKKSIKK